MNEIVYTGLNIPSSLLITPRKVLHSPYPIDWVRYQFKIDDEHTFGGIMYESNIRKLDRWLSKNIEGRWGSYSFRLKNVTTYVIIFELVNDAIIFRLKDGHTAPFSE